MAKSERETERERVAFLSPCLLFIISRILNDNHDNSLWGKLAGGGGAKGQNMTWIIYYNTPSLPFTAINSFIHLDSNTHVPNARLPPVTTAPCLKVKEKPKMAGDVLGLGEFGFPWMMIDDSTSSQRKPSYPSMRCDEQVRSFGTQYSTVTMLPSKLSRHSGLCPRVSTPTSAFERLLLNVLSLFLLSSFSLPSLLLALDAEATLVLLVAANELVTKEPEPVIEPVHDLPVETRPIQVELAQLVTRHLVPDHGAAEPA